MSFVMQEQSRYVHDRYSKGMAAAVSAESYPVVPFLWLGGKECCLV